MKMEDGIKNITITSNGGYLVATYLLGLIYLCDKEEKNKIIGFEMMVKTIRIMGIKGIVECRKKIRDNLNGLSIENKVTFKPDGFFLYTT